MKRHAKEVYVSISVFPFYLKIKKCFIVVTTSTTSASTFLNSKYKKISKYKIFAENFDRNNVTETVKLLLQYHGFVDQLPQQCQVTFWNNYNVFSYRYTRALLDRLNWTSNSFYNQLSILYFAVL